MNDQTTTDDLPLDPYETRKFFEAGLSDIAKMYGCEPKAFREHLKTYLRGKGVVKRSTTELSQEHMHALAQKIGKFVYEMKEHTPPEEWGNLDFDLIFKTDV